MVEIDINNTTAGVIYDKISGAAAAAWVVPGKKYKRKYTTAAMSLIEHDKRSPELGALLDFADFYGVSLDYLLGRDLAGEAAYEFSVDSKTRSWQLSEQLRNIILGLYSMKGELPQERQQVIDELKRLESMSEDEENLEMLRSLLKQSIILARRVEKKRKAWYKY